MRPNKDRQNLWLWAALLLPLLWLAAGLAQITEQAHGLSALSPVDVQFDDKQPTGFLADENLILYPSGASDEEVLARLPADIVLATAAQCYAEVGNEEYLHQMALAVSVEVCGRLGISPPADAADRLNGLRAHIPAGEERRALEEVREMAKVFGDAVCKELDLQRPRSDLQRAEER